jgi:hypothetical protein
MIFLLARSSKREEHYQELEVWARLDAEQGSCIKSLILQLFVHVHGLIHCHRMPWSQNFSVQTRNQDGVAQPRLLTLYDLSFMLLLLPL